MFEGKTEIIFGKNPHHCNTKTETGKKTNRLFPSSSSEDDFESTSSEESFDLKGNGKTAQRPRTGHNQDKGKSRDSGSQAQRREIDKKENQSPNSNNFSPPFFVRWSKLKISGGVASSGGRGFLGGGGVASSGGVAPR